MKFLLALMAIAGLVVHVVIFLFVANRPSSPWSGVGDSGICIQLAHNIVVGHGYQFAGTPTAFRAPLYPLFLAGLMLVWPFKWRLALRIMQLGLTICTAAACASLARRWGAQWQVAFILGL